MSVIAYDGLCVAADRRFVYNDLYAACTKIHRSPDGISVYGTIGHLDHSSELEAWYVAGMHPKAFPLASSAEEYAELIVISPKVVWVFTATPLPNPRIEPYLAWGAGAELALGAMYHGASAKEAIEAACHHHTQCGNGIDVLRVRRRRLPRAVRG